MMSSHDVMSSVIPTFMINQFKVIQDDTPGDWKHVAATTRVRNLTGEP